MCVVMMQINSFCNGKVLRPRGVCEVLSMCCLPFVSIFARKVFLYVNAVCALLRPTPRISTLPHRTAPQHMTQCSFTPHQHYLPGCCPANPGPSLVHPPLRMPSSIFPQILSTTSLSLHRPLSLPVHLSTLALNTPRPRSTILCGVSSPCHPTYTPG